MTENVHPVLESFCTPDFTHHIQRLNNHLEMREVAEGETLFITGEGSTTLFLLLEGRLAVHKDIGIGSRTQVVALMSAGAVIGESAIFKSRSRTTTVLAVEPSVVACFSQELLQELEERFPVDYISFLKKILSVTSLRLQKSSERLALVL